MDSLSFRTVRLSYSNCKANHKTFCPIIRRFISWSALGNLDSSSGGTVTLLPAARCCFSVYDDFRVFFLLDVFFTTDLRLTGLKLVRFDITCIWSWKNKTSNKQIFSRLFFVFKFMAFLTILHEFKVYTRIQFETEQYDKPNRHNRNLISRLCPCERDLVITWELNINKSNKRAWRWQYDGKTSSFWFGDPAKLVVIESVSAGGGN